MRKMVAIAFSLALLSGCATVKNNYIPRTEQISFPAIDTVNTVTLGEEMLAQGSATTTRGVYLPQENPLNSYILSEGFYPQVGEDEEYVFTSFEIRSSMPDMGTVRMIGGILGQISYPQGLRFSKAEQETCAIVPNIYGITQPICDTEYPYQMTERPIVSENDFQQTLIYSGRVGSRIRVSYRESSGNMARPAFSNDAEYDLDSSDVIAYRGARLQVISADNTQITYRVLSNFNTGS